MLIVDEVQTGEFCKPSNIMRRTTETAAGFGATGKFWGHDHWQLSSPPDIVTFSKKAQTAGYFLSEKMLRPDRAYRQFNTYVGSFHVRLASDEGADLG